MSLKTSSRVWEECPVAGNDLLLMLAIADFADDEGTNAFPSRQTLARKTRLDCSTVRRRIRTLEHKGYLKVSRGGSSGRRSNMYTIRFSGAPTAGQEPAPENALDNDDRTTGDGVDNSVDNASGGEADRPGADRPGADCPGGTSAPQGEAELRPRRGGRVVPPEPSLTVPEPSLDAGAPVERRPPSEPAGAVAAPDSSPEPETASPAQSGSAESGAGRGQVGDRGKAGSSANADVVEAVLGRLGRSWPLTLAERRRLGSRVTQAIIDGWTVSALASHLAAHPDGVRAPYAVLSARLDHLPRPRTTLTKHARPPWCGSCDEATRQVELPDGRAARCPDCHPLREFG